MTEGSKALLTWCSKQIQLTTDKIIVNDWTWNSWGNGLAFCALIHSFHSEFDYSVLKSENAKHNLELAFSTAEQYGIPRLLRVEDFLNKKLDEGALITYVSKFFFMFHELNAVLSRKLENQTDPRGSLSTMELNSSRETAVEESPEKIEKLKIVLFKAIDDVMLCITDMQIVLQFLDTVDAIIRHKELVKAIIQLRKLLEDVTPPENVSETSIAAPDLAAIRPERDEPISPKIESFQRDTAKILADLKSKISGLKSAATTETKMSHVVGYAQLIRTIKNEITKYKTVPSNALSRNSSWEISSPEQSPLPERRVAEITEIETHESQLHETAPQQDDKSKTTPKKTGNTVKFKEPPKEEELERLESMDAKEMRNRRMSKNPRRETVYRIQEINKLTDLLGLPCILDEEEIQMLAAEHAKKAKKKKGMTKPRGESRLPFLEQLLGENKVKTASEPLYLGETTRFSGTMLLNAEENSVTWKNQTGTLSTQVSQFDTGSLVIKNSDSEQSEDEDSEEDLELETGSVVVNDSDDEEMRTSNARDSLPPKKSTPQTATPNSAPQTPVQNPPKPYPVEYSEKKSPQEAAMDRKSKRISQRFDSSPILTLQTLPNQEQEENFRKSLRTSRSYESLRDSLASEISEDSPNPRSELQRRYTLLDSEMSTPNRQSQDSSVDVKPRKTTAKIILKKGYIFVKTVSSVTSHETQSWRLRYFKLDSYLLCYYLTKEDSQRVGYLALEDVIGIDDCSEEVGESFCLRITTKKGHRQASFLSSPHTEKRNKIYILRMQTREEHVSWLEALVSVFTVVNNSMRSFSKSTEVDGTILLTVIVPTLQESKRIKVDPKIDLAKLKRVIISKFKKVNNNDFESAAHQLESYQIWLPSRQKYLDNIRTTVSEILKTQDVIEFKPKENIEDVHIEGFLLTQTPRLGIIKSWKKRYFVLKGHRLYYSEAPGELEKAIAYVDLNNPFSVRALPKLNEHIFSLLIPEKVFLFQGESEEDVRKWISALKSLQDRKIVKTDSNSWIREVEGMEKEGWLFKRGAIIKNWKKRWMVMKDGVLTYYEPNSHGGLETRGSIPLYGCKIEIPAQNVNQPLIFQVVTTNRVFEMHGDSDIETRQWIDAVRRHKRNVESRVNSIFFTD